MEIDYKELRKKGIMYATRRGYPQIAEDFAQEFIIETFKGRKTGIENIFKDFIRKEYGDSGTDRSIAGRARSLASLSFQPLIDEPEETEFGRVRALSPSYVRACSVYSGGSSKFEGQNGISRQIYIFFTGTNRFRKNKVSSQKRRDRFAILESLLEGDTIKEIAMRTRVSESRICQIISPMKKQARNIESMEIYDEYKLFPEKSQLMINWISF